MQTPADKRKPVQIGTATWRTFRTPTAPRRPDAYSNKGTSPDTYRREVSGPDTEGTGLSPNRYVEFVSDTYKHGVFGTDACIRLVLVPDTNYDEGTDPHTYTLAASDPNPSAARSETIRTPTNTMCPVRMPTATIEAVWTPTDTG